MEEATFLATGSLLIFPETQRALFQGGHVFQCRQHMRTGYPVVFGPGTGAAGMNPSPIVAKRDRHDMACIGIGGTFDHISLLIDPSGMEVAAFVLELFDVAGYGHFFDLFTTDTVPLL